MISRKFTALYKGIVKSNSGTGSEGGRCKIFVPGIYPNHYNDNANAIPWAEPVAPLFGGNYKGEAKKGAAPNVKTGVCGWPNVGAHVWVFFELGDHMKPVYFGAIQGVSGWSAETNKQWVIQSDRYKLVVDEETENDRLSITVEGNVNINVKGNVTQNITGNVFEEIGGDVDRVINGNLIETIYGDVNRDIFGNLIESIGGTTKQDFTKDVTQTMSANVTTNISGNHTYKVTTLNITGTVNITGATTVTGTFEATSASTFGAAMTVTGGVTIDGIMFGNHIHSGVMSGPSFTNEPIAPPAP